MFRTKNLRIGGVSALAEPLNWPDELTNGKAFVFAHGYNVTEVDGRNWNSNIFKRLWHSGANTRFHGILWDGTPNQTTWLNLGPFHYHNAVIHAFATAPEFAAYLNTQNNPVVVAHSLGNMLTSSAICDHDAQIYQYYALDAAVGLEAYGAVTPDPAMVGDNLFDRMDHGIFSDLIPIWSDVNEYSWRDYPAASWSTEWYKIFTNNAADVRGTLTWRHRFSDIQSRTDVFNFYSSSEEVLRVDPKLVSLISATSKQYVWQIQENFKGRLNSSWLTGIYDSLGGAASDYCGWGFTSAASSQHICDTWGIIKWAPVRPRKLYEKLSEDNPNYTENIYSLVSDPLFNPQPAYLFGVAGDSFAGGIVSHYSDYLDYNTGNCTYPIANVPMRDWLLAKAFPSRTRPMGSTENPQLEWLAGNFDMADPDTGFMTERRDWPHKNKNDEPEWWHSDVRDIPYVHNYKLFDTLTAKERSEP